MPSKAKQEDTISFSQENKRSLLVTVQITVLPCPSLTYPGDTV